ncbi:MAG: NAD(P)H-hydrate dehydratase [Candidatus Pacearchaeota archaeon]
MKQITKSILKKVYKSTRNPQAHKGNFGKVLIIGGNEKYTGAAGLNALSALAVLKSGSDLVEVASPERSANIIAKFSPDLITIPLDGKHLKTKHLKKLLKESETANAFVIGSGLGREKETQKTIRKFLKKVKIPGVIDADAIYALSKKSKKPDLKSTILTPHKREFENLTNEKLSEDLNKKAKQVKEQAEKLKSTILLKGKTDIISDGRETRINKTGNAYMTKGGTGDVLAGLTAGILSQGNNHIESGSAAAYINGKAGDNLAKTKKQTLLASDLIEEIEKIITKH